MNFIFSREMNAAPSGGITQLCEASPPRTILSIAEGCCRPWRLSKMNNFYTPFIFPEEMNTRAIRME